MLDAIKKDKATFDAQQGGGPQGRCVGGRAGLSPPVLHYHALLCLSPYTALHLGILALQWVPYNALL